MRKICVVTGTRAEYGLLSRLMKMIQADADTRLQIVATNMHLLPEYGDTYQEIENDGFTIDKKVPMPKPEDSAKGIVESMGTELLGMADALNELRPNVVVILGDRYEMMMAAAAALIFRIPVAHLHGGEITEGAFDDSIRHAITKLSHLHFTSTEEYRNRVIQLGESPDRVFYVGSLGVDNIKQMSLMSQKEIEASIDFRLDKNTILVTYHPVTLAGGSIEKETDEFFEALKAFPNIKVVFTMPNSDTGSEIIRRRIQRYVDAHSSSSVAFASLGMKRYLSVIPHVAAVVGNSSSGLVEVPSFGIPTLNIGDRQKGRISCGSVINCACDRQSIIKGLTKVLSEEVAIMAQHAQNPYEKVDTVANIFKIIRDYPLEGLIQKQFYTFI